MRRLPFAYFLLLLATLSRAATASAAPELLVERGSFNFGTVAQGKKVQHTFTIRNNGDAPLQIKKLDASCGCTAAKPSASVVSPGKSAEIEVSFDSSSFSGKVAKTVTLTSNAGKTPIYTFTIEGTVLDQLQVTPRQVSLGVVSSSTPTQAKISVANHSNATVKLLNVSVTSTSLQIKPTIKKGELKPGETGTIEISVLAKPEAKILSGYLHITTSHPQKKEITVPVYASIPK
ncbi:DUF1573 domain-containing protein [Geomonas sp. Red69]|uniref:DUF1573 domain-containing protein n=1 Tax=Geomonas diazotrophica TaxID=2843197 RepID=A0ABX8JBS1_9BACT|nr:MULTISPECIES: DUF1573 domain-containing protein [Geomonas]MBU5638155.1 DUF1573 domain-containing protein [Geomonas diazotrophica]QWV95875.1 DUF1573 domain-containing protein [Geomonas nitrogeniifigens]QXE84961.1 DUF1573 domain-containing protein [Geomonas nitrogeniifigens]